MSEHACIQEKEIGRILGILEPIVKEFYGNGQKGIAREFPELRISVNNLNTTVESLRINVSALTKTIVSSDAVAVYKEKEKLSSRQRTSIYVSAIVGTASIITTLLVKLL
jgi:hypothetical protein